MRALEERLNLQDFFALEDSVVIAADGTSAMLRESSAISVVRLENNSALGDATIITGSSRTELLFEYQFTALTGADDQFVALLFDTALGPVDGELEILEFVSSASGTGRFSLDTWQGVELGLIFELHELDSRNGSTSSVVSISGLRLFEDIDSDGDGVLDSKDNCISIPNPQQANTDLDGMGNACDPDDDNDGLSDEEEAGIYGTDPLVRDTDGDGYTDGEEVFSGTNPLDSASQPDIEGLNILLIKAAMDQKQKGTAK